MSKQQLANGFMAAALSDCGLKRERNEDSYELDAELGLLLLADGMGGYTRGDVASSEAVQRFKAALQALVIEPQLTLWGKLQQYLLPRAKADAYKLAPEQYAEQLVQDLILATHDELVNLNQQFPSGTGIMGTTMVGLWLWAKLPGYVLVFHVGDSRAYRWRDGRLEQLTQDHSLFQRWLDDGQLGEQPPKNIVLQALGTVADVQPDISVQVLEKGDRLLLCSDGLTTMLEDPVLQELMAQLSTENLEQSCQDLVDRANANGGLDNVTVVLACHK